jgi:SAM-dependent methyltransferase
MPTTEMTRAQARHWLDRWDRQQEGYIADREERFAVIADVVAAASDRPDPLVVDLGAGPGSLSVRLLDRLPRATVVGVDADPLLLGLAQAAYGERGRLRLVQTDLRAAGWVTALGLERAADAVVSTTALHWLTPAELGDLYRSCAQVLRPGGVLVNGDHLGEGPERPRLDALVRQIGRDRAARALSAGWAAAESWEHWWAAIAAAPEVATLRADHGGRPVEHSVPVDATIADHVRLLHEAGFAEAGPVWQHGDDRVVVGIR